VLCARHLVRECHRIRHQLVAVIAGDLGDDRAEDLSEMRANRLFYLGVGPRQLDFLDRRSGVGEGLGGCAGVGFDLGSDGVVAEPDAERVDRGRSGRW
jgi:hypothetical protein